MKKAFLVSFSPMTRVIVDVEDEELINEFDWHKVVKAAREQMIENGISEYLNGENVDTLELDEEMPYEEREWHESKL